MIVRLSWAASAVLAIGLAAACASGDEPAKCGRNGVQIIDSRRPQHTELAAACDALRDTLGYFRSIGFDFDPKFFLPFADGGESASAGSVAGYGYAGPRSSIVVVYPRADRNPWGLPWNSKLAGSFLRHELIHIAVWQILGREAERLPREWHEFIAYAVQLDLMDPQLRDEVLAQYPELRAFATFAEVNEVTYGMDPDAFAVAAYLMYRERGSASFVRQLLRAEIVPPPVTFPLPVLPQPSPSR